MKKFFPYNPASTQVIELEAHKIVGGKIRLNSIPKEGSLTVRGFVEAQSAAHLQSNEFFCSYRADTQYREANCLVFFYAGRSGQTVYCSYVTVGTVVTADDMNEIGDFMTAANKNFDDNKLTHTELKNLITAVQNEARTSLTEHNQNVAAHSDIRDSVRDLNISNTEAHIAIRSLISNLDADLRQHKADELAARNQALLEHNSDGTAHADIRNKLADIGVQIVDLRADINADIAGLSSAIDDLSTALDTNVEMLSTDIAALAGELNSETTLRAAQVAGLSSAVVELREELAGVKEDSEKAFTFNISRENFLAYVFGEESEPGDTDSDFTLADKIYVFDDETPDTIQPGHSAADLDYVFDDESGDVDIDSPFTQKDVNDIFEED